MRYVIAGIKRNFGWWSVFKLAQLWGRMLKSQIRQLFERLCHLGKGRRLFIDDGGLGKTTRRCLLVTGAAFLPVLLAGCMGVRRDRVRLTVTVEVDGKQFTGSSVQEYVNYQGSNAFHGMAMGSAKVIGDAVVVDLGARGHLFMILCGADDYQSGGLIGSVLVSKPKGATRWQLNNDALPRFVAFKNELVSRTVYNVKPDELSEYFGPSARLVSVYAEYTKSKITTNSFVNILPWLVDKNIDNSTYLTGTRSRYGNGLADHLQYEDFTGGIN
jgi:hypothetical protein